MLQDVNQYCSNCVTCQSAKPGLYLDEKQVVRCKGRLNNSTLPSEAKRPILLPKEGVFVRLLIKNIHVRNLHSGVRDTLVCLREKYWVIKGWQMVRSVVKLCVLCKKHEGHPYNTVLPPDLPSSRVSEDPPFSHVGLDFAGPLFAKDKSTQTEVKVYVYLFTCASTRGLHLELTRGLDVDNFLLALRRFSARRGLPATVKSDNAKTFRAASKEVIKLTRSEEVQKYLANNKVTWKFIVEKAPWWEGFYERMVKGVKGNLRKAIGCANLNFEELRTLLIEVEAILNTRPLKYVQEDDEVSYSLSPSQLLYGRRITTMPNDNHFDVISTYASLTKKRKHHYRLLENFTKQWRREYLTGLRETHSRHQKGAKRDTAVVGDVVILKDDTTKRVFWKLAVIEELMTGKDGQVRAAIVKVVNSEGRQARLRRSLKHLIPLEVQYDSN